MTVDVGDLAPDFDLPTDTGQVKLSDLRGKPVVVYFYPKDDTPGCTSEALDFSALSDDFARAGATVIGISKDTAAAHGKFRKKHDLTVELAADTAGVANEAYGVWVKKSLYGRDYMGTERATFLVGRDGHIAQVWRKVKVKGHAEKVLAAVRGL